ncbi:DNA-binding transcriptional regulator, LacI/PurR family [Lentzea waywayandensis]|uniref:DNA-binding transcriptional regulator, LacI/PurR family n=1 Tax=Lentzea waywayandensis TaxID=84724 RepID=A0A1I6FGV4_9PSEU|nr:LacI family DNA-binding transcriptional regulator [Lentzea waywayandensis]SFR29186.1 DNA-binding transcriptional regulator, LacI/PurR family [Lentzea waywayandensis]
MIATSQDVADRAGVSRSTVSQILNGRGEHFAAETRARVHQAVAELGYEPSAAGRTLAKGSSDIVIALIPDTTFGGNLQDIYGALTGELSRRGLTLLLRLATHTATSLDRLLIGMKPRAVLSLTPFSDEDRRLLERRGVEAIDPGSSSRRDANAEIGALQARHLIDRGYRRLAYAHLHDARTDPFGGPRERAFAAECHTNGVDAPRILELGINAEDATAALDQLGEPGFAVGCYNDDVATALLHAASLRQWRVPHDLALIGMDHTPLSRLTTPPLTTMGYDTSLVAEENVQAILRHLDKSDVQENSTEVHFQLVEGGTT